MDKLNEIFKMQKKLQEEIFKKKYNIKNFDLANLSEKDKRFWTKEMFICAVDELCELMREVGFKHWKTEQPINDCNVRNEIVDIWHFLINISIIWGISPDILHSKYKQKHKINMQRQKDGY